MQRRRFSLVVAGTLTMALLAIGASAAAVLAEPSASDNDCDLQVGNFANPVDVYCKADVDPEGGSPGGTQHGASATATVGARVCIAGDFCSGTEEDEHVAQTGAGGTPPPHDVEPGEKVTILPAIVVLPEKSVCVGTFCNDEVATPAVTAEGARVTVGDGNKALVVAADGRTVSVTPPPVCVSVRGGECEGTGGGNEDASFGADVSGGIIGFDD